MNTPEFPSGGSSSSPSKKEHNLQLQGPRPPPLRVGKDSRKSKVAGRTTVLTTSVTNFRDIVQHYSGLSSSIENKSPLDEDSVLSVDDDMTLSFQGAEDQFLGVSSSMTETQTASSLTELTETQTASSLTELTEAQAQKEKELELNERHELIDFQDPKDAQEISAGIVHMRKESEHIKDIGEHVLDEHLVGVGSRVPCLIQSLVKQYSDHVLLLGIWGMGGIGKTTFANVMYNQIGCNFEGSSFLRNIREDWQRKWHFSLQEQLLSDIYLTTGTKISSIESGKEILKETLRHKRVLIVLDDVNKLEQLKALCGSREWFGPGSVIIITTRDKDLLNEHGVDHVYPMKELDETESLELFSWHAFKQATPREDFAELSRKVVSYSGGLPLALKVIGTEFSTKGIRECERELEGLVRSPHPDIQKVLKRSFDDLNDDTEKAIFLDTTFFFIGMRQNDVIQALQGFGPLVETKITVLVNQSLVTVDENNNVGMHVLLREMGRQIFREQTRMEIGPRIYDVFLSFRGDDTRASFTSHLYTYLQNAGIYVFRDDDEIQRGDKISISLLQAIGRSRISIIVLSRNYANSRWCMIELEKIMECHRTTNQLVVPVFYDVEPSDVRRQTGMFGEAFNDLLKRISIEDDKVQSWRTVLHEIGAIGGQVIINPSNESEEIKKIVEDITRCWLDKTKLSIADHPVGVEARVREAIELLNKQQSKDVQLLGIWGTGGIGKTTMAKSIYNQIGHNFEARSILQDISILWEQNNGQVSLQERILSDIYKTMKLTIHSIDQGKEILKERLRQKRVLLVLDDINKLEQLNALCGSHEWFCPGSCIIITTRDERLVRVRGLDPLIFRLKEMDESESVELFSWYAFRQARPREDLDGLCRHIVAYCGGLPLALQIIGSHLFFEGIEVWKSVLEDLKSSPNLEILKKLRISYDGVSHPEEKEIFLHIACFFIGMDRNDVIHILMDCGFTHPEIKISSIVKRSLVTVDNKNKLGMHDLLRNMGREIVREESEKPEKRSRLWDQKEVIDVLSRYTGTETIKGLTLKWARNNPISFWTYAFEEMKKLRLLQFSGVRLFGDFKYLSRDLTWLNWHEFPLRHTPVEFYQGSLVAIELKYSNLKLMWKEVQLLKKLKILNLSHSHDLRQTPDFSSLPNLQKLILKDCGSLSSVSDTVEHLKEILLINLKDCTSLCDLPRSFYKLKSLKTLILSGCSKIDLLEEDLEQMESLTTLIADNTAIKTLPISVVRLKSIGYISLCGYEGFSRDVFPSLILSWMSPKNNLSSLVQTSSSFSYLVCLELQSSSLPGLSYILEDLPKLRSLWVKCNSEQLDQNVEGILDTLYAINRKELEATPRISQVSNFKTSASISCCSQARSLAPNTESLLSSMVMNCQVASTPEDVISEIGSGSLPGDNDPNWLTFSVEGSSIIFEVPQEGCSLEIMMCIVYYSSSNKLKSEGLTSVLIINYTKTTIQVFKPDALTSRDEEAQRAISNLGPGNKARVVVVFGNGFTVKRTTIYLRYAGPIDNNMDHCHPTVSKRTGVAEEVLEKWKNMDNSKKKLKKSKSKVMVDLSRKSKVSKRFRAFEEVLKNWEDWGTSKKKVKKVENLESLEENGVPLQDYKIRDPSRKLKGTTVVEENWEEEDNSKKKVNKSMSKVVNLKSLKETKVLLQCDKSRTDLSRNRKGSKRSRTLDDIPLVIRGNKGKENETSSLKRSKTSRTKHSKTSHEFPPHSEKSTVSLTRKNSLDKKQSSKISKAISDDIEKTLPTISTDTIIPVETRIMPPPATNIPMVITSTNLKSSHVKFDAGEKTSIAPIFDDNISVDPTVPLEEQRMEKETPRDEGHQDRTGRDIIDQVSSSPVDQVSSIHSDVNISSSKTSDSMQNSPDLDMVALNQLLDKGNLDMFEDLLTGKVLISSQSSRGPSKKDQSAPVDVWMRDLAGLLQQKFDDFVSNKEYKHRVKVLLDRLDQHSNLLSSKKKDFLLAARSLSEDLFYRLPLLQTTINQHSQLLQSKKNLLLQTKSMKQKKVQVQANLETTQSEILTLASNISKLESELAKLKKEHAFLLSAKEKHSSENAQIEEACKLLATNIKEILVEEASSAPSFKSAEASKQHMKDAYDKLATTSKDVN